MKSKCPAVISASLGLFVVVASAFAHHSISKTYDTTNPAVLKGVIKQTVWANPHAYLLIDVKDANGRVETFAVEGSAPNALVRAGVNRNTLKQGDEITVTAFPATVTVEITVAAESNGIRQPPELVELLKAVAERAKANRLVYGADVTTIDGKKLEFGGTMKVWK